MVRLKRRSATSNGSFSLTRIEVIDPEVFALGVSLVAFLVVRPVSLAGGSGIQPEAWTKILVRILNEIAARVCQQRPRL
jgi:hypothetical protein